MRLDGLIKSVKSSALILFFLLASAGCAQLMEPAKVIWGSSMRALEKARLEAMTQSYICGFDDCFNAIISLGRNEKVWEPKTQKFFDIFMKDRVKGYIVVMGVKGNVNTTEVGIFFARHGRGAYTIEIASLSSSAKRKVAVAVFSELDQRFQRAG